MPFALSRMKNLALCLLFLALPLPALAQRFPRIANTLQDMVASNPNVVHTNVFVADTNRGGMFFFLRSSVQPTNRGTIFTTTFPGVTGRYIREFSGPLNARWFGATGDGVTDDTAALQATADQALENSNYGFPLGVPIFLPAGVYLISDPIQLKTGTHFFGDTVVRTHIRNTSTTKDTLRFYGTPLNGISCPINVERLFLYGNDAATAGAGIRFSGVTNNIEVLIRDVLIYGHYDGIVLDNTIGGSVEKTRVVNAVNNAYKLGPAITTMHFAGNVAQGGAAGDGWYIQDTVYCSFAGNASDYKKTGWYLTNVANCSFSGNGAENNTEDGMQLVNTKYLAINGLYAQARNAVNGSRSALRIDGGDSINLSGFWAAVPGGTQTASPLDLTNTLTAAFPTRVTTLGAIDFVAWGTGVPNRPDLIVRANAEDQTFTSTQSKFTRGYTSDILQQDNSGGYLQFTNTLGLLVGGHTNLLALLELNATNGVPKDVRFSTFNTNRWLLRSSATAETGSDVGSDFQIMRVNDAGAASTSALFINRANGFVALGNVTNPGYQLDVAGDGNVRGTIFGVRGVPYTWPAASALGELHNDGAGVLSWVPSGGSGATNAIVSLNGLTNTSQTLVDGGFGASSSISSSVSTHTFLTSTNFPTLSVTNNLNLGRLFSSATNNIINWQAQRTLYLALTNNATNTFSNLPTDTNATREIRVVVNNPSTFTIDWPDSVYWPPTDTELNPLTNSITTYVFSWDGTNILGYADQLVSAGGGSGTTINSTDGVAPYRINSTSFGDSNLRYVSATESELHDNLRITNSGRIFLPAGTESTPAFTFSTDNLGMFEDSTGGLGFVVGGDQQVRVSVGLFDVYTNTVFGFSAAPGTSVSGITWRQGAGTPEGTITAPVGSFYLRNNGATNSTFYVKETGSGNTGWTAFGAPGSGSGGGAAEAWQRVSTGTNFTFTGNATYEKIILNTADPEFVLTNAGTYQIIYSIGAQANNTTQMSFYLTNVTDSVMLPGSKHETLNVSSSELPLVVSVQYTTAGGNKTIELWGLTSDMTYTSSHVNTNNTVLNVIRLDNLAGSGGSGTGDVTAAANIGDNAIVRGDGGAKGVQTSFSSISDTGAITMGDGSQVSLSFNSNLSGATDPSISFGNSLITLTTGLSIASAGVFGFSGRSEIVSTADGYLTIRNDAATDFEMLRFGGVTTAFVGLQRTNAELAVMLADESAFSALRTSTVYAGTTNVAGELTLKAPLADPVFTSSLQLPNGAAPVTDAVGEIALDTTITDHQPLLQYFSSAGEMLVPAIFRSDLPTTDNYVLTYDAVQDTFVFEAQAGGGGGTVGTIINTTTPVTLYELFRAKDTTGTNAEPSMLTYNNTALVLGTNAAAPAAKRITGSVPTGADTAGASLTIAAPSGTGTGTGGSLVLGMSVAGVSSSVTNPTVTAITIAQDAQIAAATATTIAGRLRVPAGTAALPSIVFSDDDDASGTGLYRSAANTIGFALGGIGAASLSISALVTPTIITIGNSTGQLSKEVDNILQIGVDGAAPASPSLKGPDGSGSNIAGGALIVNAGQGTGAGIGGARIDQTSVTNSVASTKGSYVTRSYVYAGDKELTESAATGVFTITLAARKWQSVSIFASTHADDNTDTVTTTDEFNISLNAKTTVITSAISALTTSTIPTTGGATLTTAWTITDNGNNTWTLNNNAACSLTQVRLKTAWQIRINSDDVSTVTPL